MANFVKEADRVYGLNNLSEQQGFELGYKQKNLLVRYMPTMKSLPNDSEIISIVNNAQAYAEKLQKTPEATIKQQLVGCHARYR